MSEHDGYFGEDVAATYDSAATDMFGEDVVGPTVDALAGLAGDGRALEFGIGTGRIALPLARRGIDVHGIDLSRAMVARLRTKPGGAAIGVTIGDFATTRVPGEFALDLMARLAGLDLAQRWEDWDGRPFTHESTRHVSVWQKPGSWMDRRA